MDITTTIAAFERAAADLTAPIQNAPQRQRRAFSVTASAVPRPDAPNEQTFADQLKGAVMARFAARPGTRQTHEEQAAPERARYRPFLQGREHCRGNKEASASF